MKTVNEIKNVSQKVLDPTLRHDIVFLFDATNCNPNGDPDGANTPRVNEYNDKGLVTDVCLKRKIRDFAYAYCNKELYLRSDYLQTVHDRAIENMKNNGNVKPESKDIAEYMVKNYWDVMMFGSPLAVGKTTYGDSVYGPMQISIAESVDPIITIPIKLTRVVRNEKKIDPKKQKSQDDVEDNDNEVENGTSANGTFGDKWIVPYALYKGTGCYEPYKGIKNNVSEEDLYILFTAIEYMWQTSMSAGRSGMKFRGLYVFTHSVNENSTLCQAGVERQDKIIDSVIVTDNGQHESFNHYEIALDKSRLNSKLEIYDWNTHSIL